MDIKKGDVVELKSGSPKMTVKFVDIKEEDATYSGVYCFGGSVYCTWFEASHPKEGYFVPEQLVIVDIKG
jgi:uncharacterized protein YodC (DUF2158 family)